MNRRKLPLGLRALLVCLRLLSAVCLVTSMAFMLLGDLTDWSRARVILVPALFAVGWYLFDTWRIFFRAYESGVDNPDWWRP